jgi:hypothetical protein
MAYIGDSLNIESLKAGQEAARMAGDRMKEGESVSWIMAFCGGRHDPEQVLTGIREELGNVNIYGGAACGVITNNILDYSGFECGLAAFTAPLPEPKVVCIDSMDSGELHSGEILAKELNKLTVDGDTVLILFDQLKTASPLRLFTGSTLLNGLYDNLDEKDLHIIGAGLVGDFKFSPSFLFNGPDVVEHSAIAMIMPGELTTHTSIMHGCTPVSSFMEITRIEGSVVYELNGRRALDVFYEMLGVDSESGEDAIIPFTITLGKKYGDQFAPYSEQSYVNSLIIDSNPEDGSITLFETDFHLGTMVQIMTRDNRVMLESTRKGTDSLLETAKEGKHELVFYIDCAGRTMDFSSSESEEANVVRKTVGKEIPLLGFYSGMEICPFLGRSRPLNWTGVLNVFNNE